MQNITKDIKNLKVNYKDYLEKLNEVSSYIKEAEARLNSEEITYEFSLEIERQPFNSECYKTKSLEWKRSENGKWRIYSTIKFIYAHDQIEYSSKPLIEEQSDVRVDLSWSLKKFINTMSEELSQKYWLAVESIAELEGQLTFN